MATASPNIVVVGSLNLDLVTTTARRPAPGETVAGRSFATFVGGKGLNQAIAAARLGAHVQMIGRVGRDDFGQRLRQTLDAEGIDSRLVQDDAIAATGTASIVIDESGDNSIIIVAGANGQLSTADVDAAAASIARADMLVVQLEVPLPAVQRAAELARAAGVRVLLNPAPAQPLPDSLLGLVDVLVPNESETALLAGTHVDDDAAARAAAQALLARGVGAVVLTLGPRGALLADGSATLHVPGFRISVVDTTAAGDSFCAALAVQLAAKQPLPQAVRFANAAGALAATVLGAEPALPRRAAVEALQAAQAE